jgi:hypothetical protein
MVAMNWKVFGSPIFKFNPLRHRIKFSFALGHPQVRDFVDMLASPTLAIAAEEFFRSLGAQRLPSDEHRLHNAGADLVQGGVSHIKSLEILLYQKTPVESAEGSVEFIGLFWALWLCR